jgi:hypothetical protein
MSGFPQELVVVLVFGAILLVQFLYRLLRRKAALMQAELEPQAQAQAQALAQARAQAQAQAQAQAAAAAVLLSAEPGPVQSGAVVLPGALALPVTRTAAARYASLRQRSQHPRRFSRQDLMPDRRALRDAIVIAAIVQPCHAQRPYNVD